ncbi:MAG: DUF711 family protein [Pseudomonadota bacterium]
MSAPILEAGKRPLIRTITLGLNLDYAHPAKGAKRAKNFFRTASEMLEAKGLQSRTFRLTSQSVDELYPGSWDDFEGLVAFARKVEDELDGIWFCLAGPAFRRRADDPKRLDMIPRVLAETKNVFTNTLVSSASGMHRGAIIKSGQIIRELAELDDNHQANFRFAVMSNVGPNTPYFPASYHQGTNGFSISLELADLAMEIFSQDMHFDKRLQAFHQKLEELILPVLDTCRQIAESEGVVFKGVDFSLAPFPGEGTSAVAALERLGGSRGGQYEFLMPLFAVNQVLKRACPQCPRVGYNGTMFSVLEDNRLADHIAEGHVSIKDLLLYSTLCGCGLDMVPVALDTREEKLAALIQAISAIGMKWNKPLIARIVPSSTCDKGKTKLDHDFIVNTRPLILPLEDFATPGLTSTFYSPEHW